MFKKSLIALAALALCFIVSRTAIELYADYLLIRIERNKLINEIVCLSGASFDRVEAFLVMIENVGVDLADYPAADLANALTNGFVFKLTEAN